MSKRGGFNRDIRGDINNIRDRLKLASLRDPSILFFIVKEIIQNADDCKSDYLGIGYSEGIPDAKHLLLRGSALVFTNTGFFSKKDETYIKKVGVSGKDDNSSAVGKFGLGLKSIFLIGEVFYFLPGSNSDSRTESYMLNPWYDEPGNPLESAWDQEDFTEEDSQRVSSAVKAMKLKEGFILWVPLRQQEHCTRGEDPPNAIMQKYPGDNNPDLKIQMNFDLLIEISNLIPFLKHIQQIEIFKDSETFLVSLQEKNTRCFQDFENTQQTENSGQGSIIISQDKKPLLEKFYVLYQRILINPDFADLKKQEKWPTSLSSDGKRKKEKGYPHCQVTLDFYQPSNDSVAKGKLKIQWAVFLPTDQLEKIPLQNSTGEYTLTLHGFFFIGSDRREILKWHSNNAEALEESELAVKQKWNQYLAEQGTFLLVLPTIKYFFEERQDLSIEDFNLAFKNSQLWKDYQNQICKESYLAYSLKSSNKNCIVTKWQLIDNTEDILGVPFFMDDLSDIFSGLVKLLQAAKIVDKSKANLILKEKGLDWSSDQILLLVKSIDIKALRQNLKSFDFLKDILQENKSSLTCEIQQSLVLVLQSIFCNTTTQEIQQKAAELITFLDSHQWISLNIDDQILTAIYKVEDLEILVVSEKIKKNNQNKLTSAESAYSIFQAILSNGLSPKIESVLDTILGMIVENKSCFIGKIKTIKFIQGFELSHGNKSEDAYYSIEHIETHPKVFLKSKESTIMAEKLVQSIESFTILMIKPKFAKWVNPEPKDCDRRACLNILSSKSFKLSKNPENRQLLLEELVK